MTTPQTFFLDAVIDQGLRFALLKRKLEVYAGADRTVHVHEDGNAADDCEGSADDPAASIAQAHRILGPLGNRGVIKIAQRTSGMWDWPRWREPKLWRRLIYWGTNADFSDFGTTVLASGTVQAGSTTTVLQIPGFATDLHRGRFIRMTSGNQRLSRNMIAYHSGADIALAGGWPLSAPVEPGGPSGGNPSAGDGYEIFRPAVLIDVSAPLREQDTDGFHRTTGYEFAIGAYSSSTVGHHDPDPPAIAFVNLSFRHREPGMGEQWGDHCFPVLAFGNYLFYGCEYIVETAKGSGFQVENAILMAGTDHGAGNTSHLCQAPPFELPGQQNGTFWWAGYGMHLDGALGGVNFGFDVAAGKINGHFVVTGNANGGGFNAGAGGLVGLLGGSVYDGSLQVNHGATARITGVNPVRFRNSAFTGAAVNMFGGGASIVRTDIESVGPCVYASENAVCDILGGALVAGGVVGRGSGGTSVKAVVGGRVRFFGAAPELGDNAADDYVVLGGTPAENRGDFASDGHLLQGSGTIERLDSFE